MIGSSLQTSPFSHKCNTPKSTPRIRSDPAPVPSVSCEFGHLPQWSRSEPLFSRHGGWLDRSAGTALAPLPIGWREVVLEGGGHDRGPASQPVASTTDRELIFSRGFQPPT